MFNINQFLAEYVYGGIDGIITTFAIIAASSGANLSSITILILGLSNVIADGYSMAIARYESIKTETPKNTKHPLHSAIATFIAFTVCGIIPLLPFFLPIPSKQAKLLSVIIASFLFLVIGYSKDNTASSALQTLVLGLSAAFISYTIAHLLATKLVKHFA